MAAAQVYVEQLSARKHGLPLWNPKPIHGEEIDLANVGYLREDGFARLFNAALPPDDPSHVQSGVPEDFMDPLVIPDRHIMRSDNWFRDGQLLETRHVRAMEMGAGASANAVTVGASAQYTCSDDSGALLYLRHGSSRHNLLLTSALRSYVLENYKSWLAFANDKHSLDLRADQLVFVTGCDKASAWQVAAFVTQERSASVSLQGGLPSVAGLFGKFLRKRKQFLPAESRYGPDHPDPSRKDQCIFVRGYKVKERHFFAPKVMTAAAEDGPEDSDTNDPGGPAAHATVSSLSGLGISREDESPYHPVDVLLDYILEHSNATVALAHDDDLIALGVLDYKLERLRATLVQKSPRIIVTFQSNRAARLERVEDEPAGSSSGSQSRLGDLVIRPSAAPSNARSSRRLSGIVKDHATANAALVWVTDETSSEDLDSILSFKPVDSRPEVLQRWIDRLDETAQKLTPGSNAYQHVVRDLSAQCQKSLQSPTWRYMGGTVKLEQTEPVACTVSSNVFIGTYEGNTVAIKQRAHDPASSIKGSNEPRRQLVEEILIRRHLAHYNVVPLLGVSKIFTTSIVTPWMPNGSALSYLRKHPTYNRSQWLLDICDAFQYLHTLGIVHGNLNGHNILINRSMRACINGFGSSRWTNTEASFRCTIRRMPPELFQEGDSEPLATTAMDIYSLAITMWEMYALPHPFSEIRSVSTVVGQIITGCRPARPQTDDPDGLDDIVWNLIEECWAQGPSLRPDISDVSQRLRAHFEIRVGTIDIASVAEATGALSSPL